MEYPQRIQQQTADDRASQSLHSKATRLESFAVQQKSVPALMTKAQLWENYHQAKQLAQRQGANTLTAPAQTPSLPIAKLTILQRSGLSANGQPGDKYEQEADSNAQQVMAMPEPGLATSIVTNSVQNRSIQPIQRACTDCQEETKEESNSEEDSDRIQAKSEYGQIPELTSIQRKLNSDDDARSSSNLEDRLNGSKGGGSPLSNDVRSFMEPRFGADFSGVRVHTGSDAVQMNRDVNAQAFAHGSDIYFGAGKSPGNNELTAHELTHVVQQTGGVQTKQTFKKPDVQLKCAACDEEEKVQQIIQRKIGDGHDLASSRFAGDTRLEACFDNEDRLHEGDTGDSVVKIQQALLELGQDLGQTGVDGIYGSKTGSAVQQFKIDQSLTPTTFTDVGPKTMARLDEIFAKGDRDLPDCPDIVTSFDPTEDITKNQSNAKALVGGPKALCQIKPPANLIFNNLQDIPSNERRKLSIYDSPVPSQDIESNFGGNFIPFFKITPIFSNSVPSNPKLRKGLERVVHFMRNNVNPVFEPNKIMVLEIKGASGVFRFTNIITGPSATGIEVLLIEKTGELPSTPAKGQFAIDKTSFETKYQSFGFKLTSSWSVAEEISKLDDALTFVTVSARNKVKNLIFDRRSAKVGPDGEAGHFDPNTNTIVIFQSAFEDSAIRYGQHNFLAQAIDHEVGHATAFAPANRTPNEKLMAEFKAAAILDGASDDKTGKRKRLGKTLTVKGGITGYSDTNFNEYYAESFSLFSIAPDTFELLRPNIFNFFKKNFPFP